MRKRDIAAGFRDGVRIGAGGVRDMYGAGPKDFRNTVDSVESLKNAGIDVEEINTDEGVAEAIRNMAKKGKKHQYLDFEDEDEVEALEEEVRSSESRRTSPVTLSRKVTRS